MIGAFVGSSELKFFPRREESASPGRLGIVGSISTLNLGSKENSLPIKSKYDIRLPSPGSVFLIFQALYPYLLYAGAQSEPESSPPPISLSITGGTNVSFSPSYDFISQVLIPNFAKLGLPPLSVKLHSRGWATGHMELGAVTFKIEPLSGGNVPETEKTAVDGMSPKNDAVESVPMASTATKDVVSTVPRFPLIRLRDFDRGTITQIDITILAPDHLVSESAPSRKGDKRKKGKGNAHQHVESNSSNPSQTVRELLESDTILALEHAFQSDNDATNTPTIKVHTSEKTHHRARIYLLLVAHTSTGFRLGHDIGPGLTSGYVNTSQSHQKPGKWVGKRRNGGGGGESKEQDSMEAAIRKMVDRCVRGLMAEIADSPDDDEQGEGEYEGASTDRSRGERIGCVDKYMRDQVVVFEALGRAFSNTNGGKGGSNQSEEEEEGGLTLHSKTAMWVCEQILGV